jgi:hypothetical protein
VRPMGRVREALASPRYWIIKGTFFVCGFNVFSSSRTFQVSLSSMACVRPSPAWRSRCSACSTSQAASPRDSLYSPTR